MKMVLIKGCNIECSLYVTTSDQQKMSNRKSMQSAEKVITDDRKKIDQNI